MPRAAPITILGLVVTLTTLTGRAEPPQPSVTADSVPTRDQIVSGLKSAAVFFREKCSRHGGYVWRVSRDLKLAEGEEKASDSMCWVQPPGTPAVGAAFLDAFEVTGDRYFLEAAHEAALALVAGQMQSGGWYYSIEFDGDRRRSIAYRDSPPRRPPTGRRDLTNRSMLDDDVTPSALRLLARVDRALENKDSRIREALKFGVEALLSAQAANGGWPHQWDRYPDAARPPESPHPSASYPESWPREWPDDGRAIHYLNDNIAGNTLSALLLIHELTGDDRCLAAARRTGDFLVRAQMPAPQPAWAQQYDAGMRPVWDRKFEPPAIAGRESEFAISSLLLLHRKTGDTRYLEPIAPALDYLQRSRLPDGRLARFYELHTNRPLYFKVLGGRYELTYDSSDLPDHYRFIINSHLGPIEKQFRRQRAGDRTAPNPPTRGLGSQVRAILESMDGRGAWIDPIPMKSTGRRSTDGVIQSETFIDNVSLLCRYLAGLVDGNSR